MEVKDSLQSGFIENELLIMKSLYLTGKINLQIYWFY